MDADSLTSDVAAFGKAVYPSLILLPPKTRCITSSERWQMSWHLLSAANAKSKTTRATSHGFERNPH